MVIKMYSRRTHEGSFRIPEHYSGTAFRKGQISTERDAVGRLSALPQKSAEPEMPTQAYVRKKAPLPKPREKTEEEPQKQDNKKEEVQLEQTSKAFKKDGGDEIIISALLLSLLDGKRENSEDVTLIILLILLIL